MSDAAKRTDTESPRRMLDVLLVRGNQTAIERVRALEYLLPAYMLRRAHRPLLAVDRPSHRRAELPYDFEEAEGEEEYQDLWDRLTRDWRRDIEAGLITLTGVKTHPDLTEQRQDIPGAWAAEMAFDFSEGSVWIGERVRWVAIQVRTPEAAGEQVAWPNATGGQFEPATFDVATLTADQVATLLTRHANFVVNELGITLLPPGRASVMALVATKMRARARAHEMEATVTKEAAWLEQWVVGAAPAYQSPAKTTIINKLSVLYKELQRLFVPPGN